MTVLNKYGPPGWLRRIDPAWYLIAPSVLLIAVLYIVPLANVLVLSVTEPRPGLANFSRALTASGPLRVIMITLRVCLITTVVTVALSFCVAWVLAQVKGFHRQILIIFVVIPLWISALVRGLSWLVLLRDNGIVNQWLVSMGLVDNPVQFIGNELGVIVGMVHYLLPYGILPMFSVMRGIDERLLFASRSLGARPATTFFKVYLPLALPGVFAAGVMIMVYALGFYITPAILGGGRVVMLAESISTSVLTIARWGFGAAQAVVLMVSTMILIGIVSRTVGLKKGLG
ncbi:ABC transporter permease [Achromobacter aloeverae]